MNRKQELEFIIKAARQELGEIEDKERESKNKPQVGKCFKTRNTYGHDDGWWLYCRIIGLSDGRLAGWQFEITTENLIDIRLDNSWGRTGDGWIEITDFEFNTAYNHLLSILNTRMIPE